MIRFSSILFIIIVLFVGNSNAQTKKLTLEDIYTKGLYGSKGIGALRWMKDNKSYSTVKYKEGGGSYIARYEVESGTNSILINSSQLIPVPGGKPLTIEDYEWSADNSKLLVFTNTQKVWRYNTRGDYWVLDLKSGKLSQLGKRLPVSSLMFAKFSPDGSRVGYVSKQNIYYQTQTL